MKSEWPSTQFASYDDSTNTVYFDPFFASNVQSTVLPFIEIDPGEIVHALALSNIVINKIALVGLQACRVCPPNLMSFKSFYKNANKSLIDCYTKSIENGEYSTAVWLGHNEFILFWGSDETWIVSRRPMSNFTNGRLKELFDISRVNSSLAKDSVSIGGFFDQYFEGRVGPLGSRP
jgi:hypothetical protein